jgi:hypothetical protein
MKRHFTISLFIHSFVDSRGATRLMCETFHLEFNHKNGIVAWADGDIYDVFSGPQMKPGDFWKIQLGRCIQLDPDDFDGSLFLEDFLEEVLLYPMRSTLSARTKERWETVQEAPRIWVTRPMADLEKGVSEGSDELDNNTSDAWAVSDENAELRTAQDQALEDNSLLVDRGPVLTMDHYEQSDCSEDSSSDRGWSFHPHRPDAVFESEEDSIASAKDIDSDSEREGSMDVDCAVDQMRDSDDVAGSDFDSDEVLSGDELV